MSIERVKKYFESVGADTGNIIEFGAPSATVALAAKAAGVEEARIAKTISLHHGNGAMVIVTAGDEKIDNHKFKECFHEKARMLSPDEVVEMTGYRIGGVCPFDLPEGVETYLDVSLRRFETVFPAAGDDDNGVRCTCEFLEKYSSNFSGWIDVCKSRTEAVNQ
ncbi:MAG: YbaK/EbsC family protein [Oscillospiraceae bacterium]